jgi:hypothetical protein
VAWTPGRAREWLLLEDIRRGPGPRSRLVQPHTNFGGPARDGPARNTVND